MAGRLARLAFLLLGVELLDELYSGVPSVGAADIQQSFDTSYSIAAWALLVIPGVVALVVEPFVFVLADRYPRRWFVSGGLALMALGGFAAAWAPSVWWLAAAISLAWLGSGAGVSLAQATLVDVMPDHRELALTRWTLLGEVGDLLGPVLMAGVAAIGMSWRLAYVLVSAVVLLWALALLRERFPTQREEDEKPDEDEPSVFVALGEALRNRRLMLWLGATALCDLLDEIVVVFATLFLRDHLGASAVARSWVIGASIAGAILGVLLTDRLLTPGASGEPRVRPLTLLLLSSATCALAYAAWMVAPSIGLSAGLFFLVGVAAAPMYPITSAQAYASLPGRSGTVNAAGHAFTPFTLALPWLLGQLADHVGLTGALAVLLLQPVGLFIIALVARHR